VYWTGNGGSVEINLGPSLLFLQGPGCTRQGPDPESVPQDPARKVNFDRDLFPSTLPVLVVLFESRRNEIRSTG
jgi:hypothetical protein